MKRKAVTPAMKLQCLLSRGFTPCAICGLRIGACDKIEWDHVQALVHGGEHHYSNLRPLHQICHREKTALDVAANAKVKRLRCETKGRPKIHWPKGRKLPSRGFQKRPSILQSQKERPRP